MHKSFPQLSHCLLYHNSSLACRELCVLCFQQQQQQFEIKGLLLVNAHTGTGLLETQKAHVSYNIYKATSKKFLHGKDAQFDLMTKYKR